MSPLQLLLRRRIRSRLDLPSPSICGKVEHLQLQQNIVHDKLKVRKAFEKGRKCTLEILVQVWDRSDWSCFSDGQFGWSNCLTSCQSCTKESGEQSNLTTESTHRQRGIWWGYVWHSYLTISHLTKFTRSRGYKFWARWITCVLKICQLICWGWWGSTNTTHQSWSGRA